MRNSATLILLTGGRIAASGTPASAEGQASFAQVVTLDECDPATFNAPTGAGPDFCKNVTRGASTTLGDLFAKAAAGTPDPNWDFEPDNLTTIKQVQFISVVDQGGEPHTFTEVKQFGGRVHPRAERPRRNGRPRMCRWVFHRRGGEDPNSSGQPARSDRSVEGPPPVPVLDPSVDAHRS